MNISFSVLGWLDLHDKVDAGDIESTRRDICGNQHAEFLLLEALERHFTLILSNVAVHDLNIILDFLREKQIVGLLLRLSENNNLAATVHNEDVSKC